MKFTNRLDLPQPLVDLIINDDYSKGDADYSITELLDSPRIRRLTEKHWDEITIDVSDRLFALYGKLIHKLLEQAERTALSEKRYFMEVDGVKISGQVDRLVLWKGILQDYKFVGVYKLQSGVPEDYHWQVNCYGYLLARNGIDVRKMEIIGMLRDWKKSLAVKSLPEKYPQGSVVKPSVNIEPFSFVRKFIGNRIKLHKSSKRLLPLCTNKERWKDPDIWAVIPIGKKRAVAKYPSAMEAKEHVKKHPGAYEIERRCFQAKRCELFCDVAPWCDQFAEESQC